MDRAGRLRRHAGQFACRRHAGLSRSGEGEGRDHRAQSVADLRRSGLRLDARRSRRRQPRRGDRAGGRRGGGGGADASPEGRGSGRSDARRGRRRFLLGRRRVSHGGAEGERGRHGRRRRRVLRRFDRRQDVLAAAGEKRSPPRPKPLRFRSRERGSSLPFRPGREMAAILGRAALGRLEEQRQ